ncbi:hypothetical protein SAMN05216194_101311 [Stutzerimonas kunmingensis]|uniref:hypothetical protein n=1 Tax=Stutzerimonas kunmingensis TaxID=1211807 RepID=UPI0008DF80E0|nr:hypothetical protein [Stutzerimonas kunmingensis]MCQ2042702.1 hypothetical protein [Stutzerimonas kunmingensis]SFI76500.1 hypothetical protein SAMN05216194_101311 [Stutzerimonas kunmingensis]
MTRTIPPRGRQRRPTKAEINKAMDFVRSQADRGNLDAAALLIGLDASRKAHEDLLEKVLAPVIKGLDK